MKVAIVGPTYPHRGGIVHYTSLLAMHISRQHDVRLYGFRRQYPAWLFPGRSQIDPSSSPLVNIETQRWLIPWWLFTWQRVRRDWINWQPDIAVFQWWVPFMAPMTAWLAARARRIDIRTIILCHNVLPHERSRIDAALVRLALNQADQLIVHSTTDREQVQSLLPNHSIAVVPHPSYAQFQSPQWTRETARAELQVDGNLLLFFGMVRPYKGLRDLIDAMPYVLSRIKATLIVAGEIWGKPDIYCTRVKDLGLEQRVRFVDRYIPNSEVALYFAAADLVVLPYREATGSGVLQLAFGLGVPVVATRTGGMAETVQEGQSGFLVEPGDIEGIGNAIVRFFQEKRAAEFRSIIKQNQAAFEWDNMVNAVLGLTEKQS